MKCREAKEQNKCFSYVVCFLLDNLGYHEDIRRFRECIYERQADAFSNMELQTGSDLSVRTLPTGSKFEGASLLLQGDFDFMRVYEDIVCAEENTGFTNFNTLKPVYSDKVPPGYVRVAKVHLDDTSEIGIICSNSYLNLTPDGLPFVSSTVVRNFLYQFNTEFSALSYDLIDVNQNSCSGPACTRKMQISWQIGVVFEFDQVLGIYYYSPIYLPRWAARTRHHCWPSSDVISEISSMEGYIVPVGSIEGENPDLDWRISYVTAENKLISNLNTIQFKLYIILKMIAKELIYPDFPVISSYVVKNIVLWICELNPQSLFTADLLLNQIRKCFLFMRTCLQNNHLPNYIIPGRNLIAFRIKIHSKRQLILHINKLLDDGPSIVSRLSVFKKHSPLAYELCLAPSSVYFFGMRRDKVEKLCLIHLIQALENITFGNPTRPSFFSDVMFDWYKDERYLPLFFNIISLLFPETSIFNLLLSFDNFTHFLEMYMSRLKLYLS